MAVPERRGVTTKVLDIDEDTLSVCLTSTIAHEVFVVRLDNMVFKKQN